MQDALLGIEAIDRKSAPSSDQRTEIKNKEKLLLSSFLSKSFHLVLLKVLKFCRKFQKKKKKDKKLHATRLKRLCCKAKKLRFVLRHGIRHDFVEIHLL